MVADALKFIRKFKKDYSPLLVNGVKLSEGEVQSIAIARALSKKSKILLLVETSLAIDPESTASISNTPHRLKKEMTIVLVNIIDRQSIKQIIYYNRQ